MFKLLNDRESFYQWDLNQKLIVEDSSVDEVHFCNKTDDCSLVCEVYAIPEANLRVVDVPNILLTEAWDIRAYAYCNECYTKQSERFKVIARTKPADYVYTETEVKKWEALEERVEALEASGGSGGSAIAEDGTLLLDNGLTIRSVYTDETGEPIQSYNYVKVGKELDGDTLMEFQGWDFAGSIEQNGFSFRSPRDGTGISIDVMSGTGGTAEIDAGTVKINSYGDGIKLNCIDAVLNRDEYTPTQPNSIATIGYVDSVISGGGGGNIEEQITELKGELTAKANMEFVNISTADFTELYVEDGTYIATLSNVHDTGPVPGDSTINMYELTFKDSKSETVAVLALYGTEGIVAKTGLEVGGSYRITVNNYLLKKLERVIDLKDKANNSKVFLDVTLTEEQAGINEVFIEIPNGEALADAKQIIFHISFPVTEAKEANKVYIHGNIRDINGVAYGSQIYYGTNQSWEANQTIHGSSITTFYDFNSLPNEGHYKTAYISTRRLTQWLGAPLNNCYTEDTMLFRYPSRYIAQSNYKPYLFIRSAEMTFPAGTRVYLEVTL